jgi:hypothetical protein
LCSGRALRGNLKANREKAVSVDSVHVIFIKQTNGMCIILCVTEAIVAT